MVWPKADRESQIAAQVMTAYAEQCRPERIEILGSAGGFSGARFWRIAARRGALCLRRWPQEFPTVEQLEWLHAVVQHIERNGFRLLPMPLETNTGATFVRLDGTLWQLEPWMPGLADPGWVTPPERLQAALVALAKLHAAAASFPLPVSGTQMSPGIAARQQRLAALQQGGAERLRAAVRPDRCPGLESRAHRLLDAFERRSAAVERRLRAAAQVRVPLQPCLRDVWSEHILFVGAEVTGVIDYGAMRPDSVATDVSRLLGSMAGSDPEAWRIGLAAYQSVRTLCPPERTLVEAFDRSGQLLAGLHWLEWIYVDGRQFEDMPAILARIDRLVERLDSALAP